MLFDREDVRESGDIQDFHNLILNILQPERASFVLHPFLQCKEQAESGTADVGQFRTVEHYPCRMGAISFSRSTEVNVSNCPERLMTVSFPFSIVIFIICSYSDFSFKQKYR